MSIYDDVYGQLGSNTQQSAMLARHAAQQPTSALGNSLRLQGLFGASQFGGSSSLDRQSYRNQQMAYAAINAKTVEKKPIAMIGKITPKPGYIVMAVHHNYCNRTVTGYVRKKVLSDYTRWERLLIWLHTPW